MGEDREEDLKALGQVIETCRTRATGLDLPALAYILRKAELSLSDHAARAATRQIPRGRTLSVPPSGRTTRH